MKTIVKNVLAATIASALSFSSMQAGAATYRIIEQGTAELVENTFAQKQNDTGLTAILGSDYYDFDVQFELYLNFNDKPSDLAAIINYARANYYNNIELGFIENAAALANMQPTNHDLAWVILYLQSKGLDYSYQKVGSFVAMVYDENANESRIINIYDEKFEGTDSYTRSTNDFINGITDEGWLYGQASAPYLPITHTTAEGEEKVFWLRDFVQRGFYSPDGGETIISIEPVTETIDGKEADSYGGTSAISDVNDNRVAVGFVSTGVDKAARTFIEENENGCSDESQVPKKICIQTQINTATDAIFHTEAYKWTLDVDGVINSEELGLLVTPNVNDQREFVSVANAINNQDVAVGYATGWRAGVVTNPSATQAVSIYAVAFKNGKVIDLNNDHVNYYNSQAYDINDDGIAVGEVSTNVQGSLRSKFFYVDTTNPDDIEMIIPDGFFTSSASTARAINNNGFIVGEAEVENHSTDSGIARRKHGFIYKMAERKLFDLNDLIDCDSDYTIVQARGINDANEITATALVKAKKRDITGEVVLDEDGEPLFEEVIRAIKLAPIEGGEVESCDLSEEKVTRIGASSHWLMVLGLLVCVRQRYNKH